MAIGVASSATRIFSFDKALGSFDSFVLAEYYGGSRAVGFQRNAGRVSLFFPTTIDNTFLLSQWSLGFTNHGDAIGNMGLAARQIVRDRWIVGINGWLDGDHRFVNHYHQAGLGLELLSEAIDFRVNGYLPVAKTTHIVSDVTFTIPYYRGNEVFLDGFVNAQAAMTGFDAGIQLPLPGFLGERGIRGGADYYYFHADNSETIHGIRGRVNGHITSDVAAQVMVQHDNKYGTSALFGISMALPGGDAYNGGAPQSTDIVERLSQPVMRNFQIVVDNQILDSDESAIDADTLLPFRVVHVSSTAAPGGDGTFERPLDRIDAAAAASLPGDIILVHRGSMFSGQAIALQNQQRLLGGGIDHPINTVQLGVIQLAPVGMTGNVPLVMAEPSNSWASRR